MSEQHVPDFEERVRALLARAAEAMPADTDVSARVRQAHAQGRRLTGTGRIGGWRHGLATVAALLVVALLAGLLLIAHPRASSRPAGGVTGTSSATAATIPTTTPIPAIEPPTCGRFGPTTGTATPPQPVATPIDHSVAVDRHASLHGISITIDRAYADATQTVITYHMQTNLNPPLPDAPVVIDAQGHRFAPVGGDWDISRGGEFIFAPLPPEELGTPQLLTLLARQMRLADPTGPGALVDGPWRIQFSLTPAKGTSVALSTTPLTRHGLSIQPLRLDLAPAGGGLDGATGGARVVIEVSGLAAAMRISDLLKFDTVEGQGAGSTGCGGGIAMLVLPDGHHLLPSVVQSLGQIAPTTPAEELAALAQTVGPGGAATLELLFNTPVPTDTGLILYVDQVPAQLAGATTRTMVSGPWEFPLQPSA
jgi:hypothetical protein